ncbi:MAG: phosphotransferase [Patescibacteria group bacterium]|mgnify:CR=1 FL=1
MIKIFDKVIRERGPELLAESDFPLCYLKFSTVTSGSRLNDKVIFLVFKNRAPLPFLCLKTVRNYEAKQAISRNFSNLKKLNELTTDSPYAPMFAQALHLYDDGENIFSIETACPGKRVKLNNENLKIVVAEYIGFQQYAAERSGNSITDMAQFAKEIVIHSGLKERDQQELLQFLKSFSLDGFGLPRVIQHGDLTEDNILLSKDKLCVIDYDFVDDIDLPGFDLFGLFRRYNQHEVKALCNKYLPEYFTKIGADIADIDVNKHDGLLFLYYFTERILKKRRSSEGLSAELIISDFNKHIARTDETA